MNSKKKTEVENWLKSNLNTWKIEDNHITRTYETGSWQLSLMVTNGIGFLCEREFHHPTLVLNYPNVKVMLQTHDASGITDKDLDLAKKIEQLIMTPSNNPNKWIS